MRYAAPRSEGSHAERFMALALALHGGDNQRPLDVRVITVGDSHDDPWLHDDNEAIWTPLWSEDGSHRRRW